MARALNVPVVFLRAMQQEYGWMPEVLLPQRREWKKLSWRVWAQVNMEAGRRMVLAPGKAAVDWWHFYEGLQDVQEPAVEKPFPCHFPLSVGRFSKS